MKKYGFLLLLLLAGTSVAARISSRAATSAVPMRVLASARTADIRPVRWIVVDASRTHTVVAGRGTPVTLEAQIAKGWHIYSPSQKPGGPIPLTIRLVDSSDAVIRGLIEAPKPDRHFDKNFGIETETYSGDPQFIVQLAVPGRASPGVRKVELGARYQVCSETLCLPPRTDRLPVTLRVAVRP